MDANNDAEIGYRCAGYAIYYCPIDDFIHYTDIKEDIVFLVELVERETRF